MKIDEKVLRDWSRTPYTCTCPDQENHGPDCHEDFPGGTFVRAPREFFEKSFLERKNKPLV